VGGSAPRYLHRRRKLKRWLSSHARDNAQHARCLGLFTVQIVQCPTHYEWGPSPYDNNIDSPDVARQQGRRSITRTTVKGVRVSCFFDGGIPTSQQLDVALQEQHKSDKELPSLSFLFSLSLQKIRILAKIATIRVGRPARVMALGGYPD
jgi:hypothetical protein